MKQEEKDLLLKYLCMALPYGVKIEYVNTFCKIRQIVFEEHSTSYSFEDDNFSLSINDIQVWKPYLRPMSSMTDEEKEEFESLWDEGFGEALDAQLNGQNDLEVKTLEITASYKSIQWLLKNHFDFMGLIPKGLAIEVTKENNPYK